MGIETIELTEYLHKNFTLAMTQFSNHWEVKINERELDLWLPNTCDTEITY